MSFLSGDGVQGIEALPEETPKSWGQVSLVGGQAFLAAESHLIRDGWKDGDLWGHWLDKACTRSLLPFHSWVSLHITESWAL